MKTKMILLTVMLLLGSVNLLSAQQSKFEEQMLKQIEKMKEVKTPEELNSLSAVFKRMALAEQSHWEPYYYAGLCYINVCFWSNKFSDESADEIEQLIGKAFELGGDASELYCLESYVSTISMMVNPQERYATYGVKADEFIEKAIQANPENPRAFLIVGESTLYKPEQFGGGKQKALPYLKKSLELFKKFKNDNPLHPNWGRNRVDEYMKTDESNAQ